jgi:hypothetical protein
MVYASEKRDCFEEYESRAKEKSHIDDYQDGYKCVRQCSSTIVFFFFWTVVEILMKYFRAAGNLK